MSTTKSITIEDQYGVTLDVETDGTVLQATITGGDAVELDETDRRDLAEFLSAR